MDYPLNRFIDLLEQEGELLRVKTRVSSDREIAEITDRFAKEPGGGKALLFERTDSAFPVLTNMLGSEKRIGMALRVNRLEELTERIDALFGTAMGPKKTILDKLKLLPLLGQVSQWMPREKGGRGACQEVILKGEEADLFMLPVLKCAPFDGGRFITLPLVHTVDPETGGRNVGMYRIQLFDKQLAGLHAHIHKTGARHYESYKKLGRRMEVAVTLGGDPAYTYSATAPLPDGVDEYMLTGFIRQRPVELVKCVTNDIRVPADSDFVIEGYVDPSEELITEGPFGDHTGFYSLEDLYPRLHITAITHRRDAVYPATVVGIPPQEDYYIGRATEKIFLAPIKAVVQPEVRAMSLPAEGVAHNIALIDIEKRYPGQAVKVASSLWGAGQMMFNKIMVLTSGLGGGIEDRKTLRGALANLSVPEDLYFFKGTLDVLDHTAPVMGFGGKMALDATVKTDAERAGCEGAGTLRLPEGYDLPEGVVRVDDTPAREGWRTLFAALESGKIDFRRAARELLARNGIEGVSFLILTDERVDLSDRAAVLWLAGGNTDMVRDTFVAGRTLVLDARTKAGGVNGFSRRWPNVVTMDAETIRAVDRKWKELQIGPLIPSPSLRYLSLVYPGGASVIPGSDEQ